ncbi:hypothetical protein OEZ85_002785 [Tetradesmus obliquus]|uniref:ATPase family AAA domain-containing protein n=1 Tax=Tetradesmus obliquus TaxID=3088 RepID=A0ABY8TYP2_TETOB|nr:hypothetical protein OEZ85_002785 [Tetradesmus obliquus]
MLTSRLTARTSACQGNRQHKHRQMPVMRSQQHDSKPVNKIAPALLSAGLALSLLLASPHAAEARVRVNLQQQREEQERLYAEQMRKLDAVLEQQIKAKQAAAGAKSTPESGAGAKSARGSGK